MYGDPDDFSADLPGDMMVGPELARPVVPPKNLAEVMVSDQSGWRVTSTFWAELAHHLMGTFPALIKGTDNPVITTDREVLKKVCALLAPHKMKVHERITYVNSTLGLSVRLLDHHYEPPEKCAVCKLVTQERFDALVAQDPHPFEWTPCLVGFDTNREEFVRTLETILGCGPG